MEALVAYDSFYGNTEKIARAIADALAPSGEVKVLRAGEVNPSGLKSIDLLIVGSPTQGGRPTRAMQDFLDRLPDPAIKGMNVAAFDTRFTTKLVGIFGYAAGKIAGSLKKRAALSFCLLNPSSSE
jgi:flavodoxin I